MGIPLVVVTLNSKVIERTKLNKEETTMGRTRITKKYGNISEEVSRCGG